MSTGTSEVVESLPFSKELRARTKRKLSASRTLNNLTVPLALSSPRVYLEFLRSYGEIFRVFEDEFEKRRRVYPRLNALYFRELLRTKAFLRDIDYYEGRIMNTTTTASTSKKDGTALKSVEGFITEMKNALAGDPVLIVAYSYSLYLGLYVASPRIQAFIRDAFDLNNIYNNNNDGVCIWDFSATIANRHGFRKRYNTAMDDFDLSHDEKQLIVAHVHRVLDSSNRIFAEIRSSNAYRWSLVSAALRALCGASLLAAILWTFFEPFKWAIVSLFLGM